MHMQYQIGIDEAGRGPLAGPVAVGAVFTRADFDFSVFKNLKDSKKLSENRRKEIFLQIKKLAKEGALKYSVALVLNDTIDKKGISYAIKAGIEGVLSKIAPDPKNTKIFLDGSLKASENFSQETIIKGDEKISVISLASIVAKVTRDEYMQKIAKEIPNYDFEIHKGYGTSSHIKILKKSGPSKIHRLSFCKNFI